MVRQAHTYLVSAMSGATLIAAAIAVFVVLVSVQVFEAWPITGLGGGGESASVAPGRAAEPGTAAGTAAKGNATGTAESGSAASVTGQDRPGSNAVSTGAAGDRSFQPGSGAPAGETGSGAAPDGAAGSPAAQAAGNDGGADGAGGGQAGGGSGGGSGGSGAESGSSPSGNVTNTVNETVNQVDQTVTGGALEEAGVTGVTEEVVDGVLGPESTVGKVVDGAAGAVGGLLNPKR